MSLPYSVSLMAPFGIPATKITLVRLCVSKYGDLTCLIVDVSKDTEVIQGNKIKAHYVKEFVLSFDYG
jgi:hypothetical protein